MTTAPSTRSDVATAMANLVRFLETGDAADDLFAADLFADVTLPHWRLQADTAAGMLAIREAGHPCAGRVHVARVDRTEGGFTMEFEERWRDGGQDWYCREMIRADVVGATIVDMAVYCTGDWDEARQREHAAAVRLLRP